MRGVEAGRTVFVAQNGRHFEPHAVVELLREDPAFADEYLSAALDEVNQPGGREALLAALRHIAEAQGMATVAERAGMPREKWPRKFGQWDKW
jgi:DNA-binding phage protein